MRKNLYRLLDVLFASVLNRIYCTVNTCTYDLCDLQLYFVVDVNSDYRSKPCHKGNKKLHKFTSKLKVGLLDTILSFIHRRHTKI